MSRISDCFDEIPIAVFISIAIIVIVCMNAGLSSMHANQKLLIERDTSTILTRRLEHKEVILRDQHELIEQQESEIMRLNAENNALRDKLAQLKYPNYKPINFTSNTNNTNSN
jgi:hypothetical protein